MEKKESKEIVIVENGGGQRLDAYLALQLEGQSRSQVKKLIDQGCVLLNGKEAKGRERLSDNDEISVSYAAPSGPAASLNPAKLSLNILFEDSELVVIDKPAGLVVHPGAGTSEPTLVEGLLYHLGFRDALDMAEHGDRPGIVHRLDKDTTGVLVCSKNQKAHHFLSKQFADKTNLREYVALLSGHVEQEEMEITSYLGRDPKNRVKFVSIWQEEYDSKSDGEKRAYREARSQLKVAKRFVVDGVKFTLASFRLYTGRTHQIRLHAAAIGHHVYGDPLYAGPKKKVPSFLSGVSRQLLHARYLGFEHPKTLEKLAFESDLPSDFAEVLRHLNG